MSEDRSVQGAVYALIESMLDLGKTPAEVRYGLGRVMSELKIAPVAVSPTDGASPDPDKGQAPQTRIPDPAPMRSERSEEGGE